jgi:hypothetical protein
MQQEKEREGEKMRQGRRKKKKHNETNMSVVCAGCVKTQNKKLNKKEGR